MPPIIRSGGIKILKHYNIVAAFIGMHVSPAKHSYALLPRKCDYQTDRHTDGRTDRQTPDKVIPMCRYASQVTYYLWHYLTRFLGFITICYILTLLVCACDLEKCLGDVGHNVMKTFCRHFLEAADLQVRICLMSLKVSEILLCY